MYEKCLRDGVNIHQGGPHSTLKNLITEDGGVVKGIQTVDGKKHYADLVILATGAWTASLVDMENMLIATGHAVVHFKPEGQDNAYFDDGFPVWAGDISNLGKTYSYDENETNLSLYEMYMICLGYYGFPTNHHGKVKVACHAAGYVNVDKGGRIGAPRTRVANPNDTMPHNSLKEYRKFLGEFMPKLNEHDIVDSRVCW